jgi:hypothetical protein
LPEIRNGHLIERGMPGQLVTEERHACKIDLFGKSET